MNTAQTAVPDTSDGSIGTTKFPYVPIQFIPAEIDTEEGIAKGRCFIKVFRYAVAGGWIVGTMLDSWSMCSQSFVPDPDHAWTATFPNDETQTALKS